MTKPNAQNERIKREYFRYLAEAKGRDEATIDSVAKSVARFEASTRAKDFKRFHREQAVAFKAKLAAELNARTGERLSKSTVLATMRDLREFFFWLAHLPGFKSHIAYADADYFNLSDKDVAVARARREKRVPTLEQVNAVLAAMPADTPVERRDRAIIALLAMTGTRVAALASLRLCHVDLAGGFIDHDARVVRTKAAKTFRTFFLPIEGPALEIFSAWVEELQQVHLRGPADPLFPATEMGLNAEGAFTVLGLAHQAWSTTDRVREIVKRGFATAGIPYCNPHTFRDMLTRHVLAMNLTPEQIKACSQNLGHSDVATTLMSYGQLPTHRQGELIKSLSARSAAGLIGGADHVAALEALLAQMKLSSPTTSAGGAL